MEQKTEASQAVDEHKPCPFCGTAPRYLAKQEGIYCELVICDTCGLGLAPSNWNRRAALKAQPAPTEAAQGEPFEKVTIADAKFAIKQMQNFVNTDAHLCLLLDANIDTLRTFVHGRAEAALAERTAAAAQGNTSNNSSSSQLSGNSGELQPSGNTGELAQGEDSARLECLNMLINSGAKAWPRSCLRCGLGPCQTGTDRARARAETGGVKS